MKKAIYEWKEGQRRRIDAQTAGERLELIRRKNKGELKPEYVVDDARDPDSPLHPEFEWDDEAAAEKHRTWQARKLIRAVVVEYRELPDGGPKNVFVNVQARGDQYYTTIPDAMSDDEARDYVLRKVHDRLVKIKEEYEDMQEFAQVWSAVDSLELAA